MIHMFRNTLVTSTVALLVACGDGSETNATSTSVSTPVIAEKAPAAVNYTEQVLTSANTWVDGSITQSANLISDSGISNWQSTEDVLTTYVYFNQTGQVNVALSIAKAAGKSTLSLEMANKLTEFDVDANQTQIELGEFTVTQLGYQRITLRGIKKSAQHFPSISAIKLGGEALNTPPFYVRDDVYWGRRGPSVHLSYQLPDASADYQWFYNEVTVPEGYDPIGSYFMANGFAEGYFGIQVNSAQERRVLFSVWSPYQTDDPSTIPEAYRVKLLRKGDAVNTGEFGNEGSGGQSFLRYTWQAGQSYRFLLSVKPSDTLAEHTEYTAYFFAPELNQWQLIASFARPQTATYLSRPHSFLENFIPEAGHLERKAFYTNQWVATTDGRWSALTQATFTYDATARKQSRRDYQGGVEENRFYLRNTGFFSDSTEYHSVFTTQPATNVPDIKFEQLP
ncbi:DUF3472 domain-containing protein [Pseudoalteromonas fenneropenaei]|uniref:DUF3472 domain-containing protein n=1 Tax=Pseudoalteromonas fenneropenaei TaxID=1737459 RepID=A0ABV7CQ19_9GAMM